MDSSARQKIKLRASIAQVALAIDEFDRQPESVRYKKMVQWIATLEDCVGSTHPYREQVRDLENLESIANLKRLQGVLEATLDDLETQVIEFDDSNQRTEILIKALDKLLDDITLIRTEIVDSGKYDTIRDKTKLWVSKATEVLAKLFGVGVANKFHNIMTWRRAGRAAGIRDFDTGVENYRTFLQSLRDEVLRDPNHYGAKLTMNDKKATVISIVYSPDQHKEIESWAHKNDIEVGFSFNAIGTFADNIVKTINQKALMEADVDGFVIASRAVISTEVFNSLYILLKSKNFLLFVADSGSIPISDNDISTKQSRSSEIPATVHNTTIHNYAPSINVASGSTAHHVQQINLNLQTLKDFDAPLAQHFTDLTEAIEIAVLPEDEREEALDRVNELVSEVSKPDKKSWKIKERLQGLMEFVGKGAETAGKVGEAYLKLQPIVDAISSSMGS